MSFTLKPASGGSYSCPTDPGEPQTGNPRLSVTDQEGAILSALFHKMTVAEFGTGLGVSTRALAETALRVHTVDVDPWVHRTIWPELPGGITCHKDRSKLPKVIDGVFVDADHSVQATADDVADALNRAMLLVVVHDVNYTNVRQGCEMAADGWLFIPTTHGLGVKWLT